MNYVESNNKVIAFEEVIDVGQSDKKADSFAGNNSESSEKSKVLGQNSNHKIQNDAVTDRTDNNILWMNIGLAVVTLMGTLTIVAMKSQF